ncbi:MAG: hypothetical protein HY040_07135 [Planctomycetes bacterium]|nr:hypothetical protein [Planctomycetota bacterium]
MSTFELMLIVVTTAGAFLGGLSIYWARGEDRQPRTRWGRRLFVMVLLGLGGLGLAAATARAHGLPPLGILAGLLVVAMLWESPEPSLERPT